MLQENELQQAVRNQELGTYHNKIVHAQVLLPEEVCCRLGLRPNLLYCIGTTLSAVDQVWVCSQAAT